jgi:hypothetical protein
MIDAASLRSILQESKEKQKSDKRISVDTCETVEDSGRSFDLMLDTQEQDEGMNVNDEQDDGKERNKERKSVNFATIAIREFARALGDNPATTNGPPLALDWDYEDLGPLSVDEYERTRPPRRITDQMVIPGTVRERILLSQTETTKHQIKQRIGEVRNSRHKRQVTVAMQDFEEWHVVFEFLARKFRRMRSGISKQREQELLWEQAEDYRRKQQQVRSEDASSSSTDEGPLSSTE